MYDLEKVYEEYLENETQASENVRQTYDEMNRAFDDYLCAVQEDSFRKVFAFGYAKGIEAAKKKRIA